eukprot:scaffold9945_cov159-Ochromonas_danica.AAC.1
MASSVNELKSKIPDYSKPMILPPPDQDQKSYFTEGRLGLERPNFTPSSGLSNLGAFQSANLHYPGTSMRMDTPTIGGSGELKTQSDDSIAKEKHMMTLNDPVEVAKQGIEQLGSKEAIKTVVHQTP